MKNQTSIPVGKVKRAAKFAGTGAKIGGNYLKFYAKKLINKDLPKSELDEANAADIYESLSQLKGSALKVAQMMSMDNTPLPAAYAEKFQMAQYNAPPLSLSLVISTFRKNFGKSPFDLFDTFSEKAVNAASIGQVHKATLQGKTLAVKVQYPGVADSISSDLKLAKPIAMRLLNIKGRELDVYLTEVEERLIEETQYSLELKRSQELAAACASIPGLDFPHFYPEFSCERILTMDWVDGTHLSEWVKTNPPQEIRNQIGQALWDFYNFQIHQLKKVHADPHPGNFIITAENKVGVLDFGCVKEIPEDFYRQYFKLLLPETAEDDETFIALLDSLEFYHPDDTPEERTFFTDLYREMMLLLCQPFYSDSFDFGDEAYFNKVLSTGEALSTNKELRKSNAARGPRHAIYINRTYLGLFSLLHLLRARVNIKTWIPAEIG